MVEDLETEWKTALCRTELADTDEATHKGDCPPAPPARPLLQSLCFDKCWVVVATALLLPIWKGRVDAAQSEVAEINGRIRDYNLSCPAPCQRMMVRLERELGRLVYGDPAKYKL